MFFYFILGDPLLMFVNGLELSNSIVMAFLLIQWILYQSSQPTTDDSKIISLNSLEKPSRFQMVVEFLDLKNSLVNKMNLVAYASLLDIMLSTGLTHYWVFQ